MGLISTDRENETKDSVNTNFENVSKINFNKNSCHLFINIFFILGLWRD